MAQRRERLTWDDVNRLIDHLIPQFEDEFEAMVIITTGGVIPGGLLCEKLGIKSVLTAGVDFPYQSEQERAKLLAWPRFIQFPDDEQLAQRKILIVDDVWGSGRTITAVRSRVSAAEGEPSTCVLHFNPYRSLFSKARPDYYAVITDAYIVYPWENPEGPERMLRGERN